MSTINEESIESIKALIVKKRNILLTGDHGIGKTFIVMSLLLEVLAKTTKDMSEKAMEVAKSVARKKIKYYSCATLDPWVDLVGVPTPDTKTGTLNFCRPKDLLEAEVVVADEINRSHTKVQNALLEMIQFKTINGQPLPNLRQVIAMQNPATKMYQVTDLDPALVDRFHARITLTGSPSVEFYKTRGIDEPVAQSLVDWWNMDLSEENRHLVTPRTLETIGMLIQDKLDWKFSIGDNLGVMLVGLEQRLATNCGISKYEKLTLKKALQDLEVAVDLAKNDRDYAVHIVKQIETAKAVTGWDAAEIINVLPQESQMRLMQNQKWVKKMNQEYPLLHESFFDCDSVKILHQKLKKVGGPGFVMQEDYEEESV